MKISKDELEKLIKEELAAELSERGLDEVSLNPFKGITTPVKTLQRSYNKGRIQGRNWREKLSKWLDAPAPGRFGAGPRGTPATTATTPTAAPTATPAAPTSATPKKTGEDVMPISGTEFQTMQYVAKQNGTDILKAIRRGAANIGAAARDPQSQQLVKSFNKAFFPALVKMTKNPNIDIAEGVDMEAFLEELLLEQNEPLTRRQQAQKKGKARGRLGAQAYFKSVGGKPPLIVRQIAKSLEDALLKKVDATPDGILYDAAAEAAAQIKDPKDKKEYEGAYIKLLATNPKKRLEIYKQNVAAFIQAVAQIAMAAAASVEAPAAPRRSLPEEIRESENKELGRMKVSSGIQ